MATKIDTIKLGNSEYEIDLKSTATPSIASLTTSTLNVNGPLYVDRVGANSIQVTGTSNLSNVTTTGSSFDVTVDNTVGLCSDLGNITLYGEEGIELMTGANDITLSAQGGGSISLSADTALTLLCDEIKLASLQDEAYIHLVRDTIDIGSTGPLTISCSNFKTTADYTHLGGIKPWYSTTGKSTYGGTQAFTTNPAINAASTTNGRFYPIGVDANGRAYVNVPWNDTHIAVDSSLNSSSTNPLQNKAIYSLVRDSLLSFSSSYFLGGTNGSWRIKRYNSASDTTFLDIRYGQVSITSQEKTYNISFGTGKSMLNYAYCVVCGIYSTQNKRFWTPIVQSKGASGFSIYLRGNSSGDNSGTLFYIAIYSNVV